MKKRVSKALIITAACMALTMTCVILFLNRPELCLRLDPDDVPVTVCVYSEESYLKNMFRTAAMGQSYDYELVIRRSGLAGPELLRETFRFADDGAPIHKGNIRINENGNNVTVIVSGSEMSDRTFEFSY